MSEEYRALVAKVEGFTAAAFERRRADMACKSGCDGCCHVWLTVSAVEADVVREGIAALSTAARAELAARGRRELDREEAGEAPRCAMLADDGRCDIYAARPLVCRTQGHALRYPSGFVPVEAVRIRAASGEVTHCPLNFTGRPPEPADVLDAERVDQILALVNHRYALARGVAAEQRAALSRLAAEADVLERPGCD
jgi:Fe-S-cluster containining protein